MIKQLEQVKEFHKAFNLPINKNAHEVTEDLLSLRASLIKEESEEVTYALWNENSSQIAKELADLVYVVYGTVLSYGLQDKFEEVFDEVHRSNMSKLDENGKVIRREDGKVLKSNLYSPANIEAIL